MTHCSACELFSLFCLDCHVFANKDDAIRLIKEKKGGRFKAFSKRAEAEEFSRNAVYGTAVFCSPRGNSNCVSGFLVV